MELQPNFKLNDIDYKVWKFVSGEIQVQLLSDLPEHDILITGSIFSSDNLMELLLLVEAIRSETAAKIVLIMPYCAYSRQDRRCNEKESFSLKTFAQLINSCNFEQVITCDNHSDVSTALIDNCTNIPVTTVLASIDNFDSSLYDYFISPDAGANKKVFECSKHLNIPMIRADKVRDTSNGNIVSTDVYTSADRLENKTVLIIDDICQGGRTFEELAKAIKEIQPACTIHLFVTHGFFSSGFAKMVDAGISKFITTDSVIFHNYQEDVACEGLVDVITL